MLIEQIAARLGGDSSFARFLETYRGGADATLGVPLTARALVSASLFVGDPRPTLVVVSGEEAAVRYSNALAAYIDRDTVLHLPLRQDLPWSERSSADQGIVGARCQALHALADGQDRIVVSSARALLRCVPPAGVDAFSPLSIRHGGTYDTAELAAWLIGAGYERVESRQGPGTFLLRGDTLEVYPAGSPFPIRVGFFGDEVDSMRRLVPATGQSIGDLDSFDIYPCREMRVTDSALRRIHAKLDDKGLSDSRIASALSMFDDGIAFPGMDRYLPDLFPGAGTPIAHLKSSVLVEVIEPRSLFDDASRYYDEVKVAARDARVDLTGLYVKPAELDFGHQQRVTMLSIQQVGSGLDATLEVKRPNFSGTTERMMGGLRGLVASGYTTLLALPDRHARSSFELDMLDAHIPFTEHLDYPLEGETGSGGDFAAGMVNVVDTDIPSGMLIPAARLALLSLSDSQSRSATRRVHKQVDPTTLTFPYKPGDYVVHSLHGVALFKDIVSREVAGVERDYLLLEYANDDKLFVPVEQVDKVTRYVGPEGSSPRLTRLNTADWSRAIGKARKNARKLAFDLVDLYARRSTISGFRYSADTPWQKEMEETFAYHETPDQLAAIADVKADMESERPMDRLICGDVGFGKTEVVLRAAFKAVQDERQVMVLCPTTILAQQHFTTFSERFAPFDVSVEVLSRFRTTAQQKAAIEGFSEGTIDVLIGTHRLLSRDINPKNLGLVIIDEEQRFGVGHKEQLKTLREQVDVITLSATPIPRTMQMALSGVRDMSLILTPPPERMPVKVHVGEWDPNVVSSAIRFEMDRGGQVYYVSNRVKSIESAVARVAETAPEARIGVAHGQMNEHELEKVMESFAAGETDVLVATTIIESGLDNPHTNTLIVEDSQRLGLAQLYQLKGRVGRGREQAYSYFLFPENALLTEQATDRLQAISEFQDLGSGTKIAMRDLEIRGAGSLLGAEQSGNISAVGFDLFASMIAEAVGLARGETEVTVPEVRIDLPGSYYLSDRYIPDADERVLIYRKLAAMLYPETIAELADSVRSSHGDLPAEAVNLFERARIRSYAAPLGIDYVAEVGSKLVFSPVALEGEAYRYVTKRNGVYIAKKNIVRIAVPYGVSSVDLAVEVLGKLHGFAEEEGPVENQGQ